MFVYLFGGELDVGGELVTVAVIAVVASFRSIFLQCYENFFQALFFVFLNLVAG